MISVVMKKTSCRGSLPSSPRHQIEQIPRNLFLIDRQEISFEARVFFLIVGVLNSFSLFFQILDLGLFVSAATRVQVLGHSFIRLFHDFRCHNFNQKFTENSHIPGDLCTKWHGIGGRTYC